jgi:hypothetical protein
MGSVWIEEKQQGEAIQPSEIWLTMNLVPWLGREGLGGMELERR